MKGLERMRVWVNEFNVINDGSMEKRRKRMGGREERKEEGRRGTEEGKGRGKRLPAFRSLTLPTCAAR